MERKFEKGNIVIPKDIGTRCMKVIGLSEDYDDEAKSYFLRQVLLALDKKTNDDPLKNADSGFNENEHLIYYVTCEWYDDNGVRHDDIFEEGKLEFYQDIPPRVIIEGFNNYQK